MSEQIPIHKMDKTKENLELVLRHLISYKWLLETLTIGDEYQYLNMYNSLLQRIDQIDKMLILGNINQEDGMLDGSFRVASFYNEMLSLALSKTTEK